MIRPGGRRIAKAPERAHMRRQISLTKEKPL
jgi:hypothetical protein